MFFGNAESEPAGLQDNNPGEVIFDVSTADFEDKVIKASMEGPVIAYFTAPWCGPCKQLGPVIEAAVQAAGGTVKLAKINLDDNQELAQALRIQSVPTIFGFLQGRPVDAFQGAVPESQVKEFIAKLVQAGKQAAPDALDIPEALKSAAQALADGDLQMAQGIYMQVLQQDEKNVQAFSGLVRMLIAAGETQQARQMVDNAPDEIAKAPGFDEAKTALELAEMKPDGSLEDLATQVEKKPEDHQARFDLALAQFSGGQKEAAIESLIEVIRRQADWNEEAARKQLLKFFEALGHSDPLTIQGRKKLSSILFS